MRSVDDIGDELYALPPSMFTAARDAAVARARADGDVATARHLAALKRPTYGAFLVNLLALRRPDVVAELIDLGEQIRAAQGTVSAAELRDLTARRRAALSSALAQSRALVAEAGAPPPSATQVAEAEATLAAAMADPAAADLVRSGRVVKALSYSGFGDGSGAISALTSRSPARRAPAAPAGQPAGTPPAETDEQAELERRRAAEQAAREQLRQAEETLAAAWAEERAASDEVERLTDEINRLRTALDEASRQVRTARAARQAAERAVAAARRKVAATTGTG